MRPRSARAHRQLPIAVASNLGGIVFRLAGTGTRLTRRNGDCDLACHASRFTINEIQGEFRSARRGMVCHNRPATIATARKVYLWMPTDSMNLRAC